MELDFDKEIDALLRKARGGTEAAAAAPDLPHLDADEIAAFAENALPEKTRQAYIVHFAVCDRCRKILSQSILLNAEAEQSAAASPEITAPALQRPAWRQRLFGMPAIAYTMGALVLLFSGFLGLAIWQNMGGGATGSRVAQNEPYSTAANSNAAGNTATAVNAASNAVNAVAANTMAANTALVAQAPSSMANAAVNGPAAQPIVRPLATPAFDEQAKALGQTTDNKVQQPAAAAPPPPAPKSAQEEVKTTDSLTPGKDDRDELGKNKQLQAESELRAMKKEAPAAAKRAAKPPLNGRNVTPMMDGVSGGFVPTRTVNGHTFTKKDGVWYDADYHGQSTINVRRGTDAYKKLDAGLRSIADSLGGTLVAVWKGRGYRIQ
ncbi:MAG TPA: hypothetical protein VL325_03360 [Pyrinomonadaceae bacterium]|nr:hypothetical protein [Pyrinomonadaceae bacterium]